MSRNPYIVEGQPPTLRYSVFVLMDILGYADLIKQSQKDSNQESELIRLHQALSESRKNLEWTNNNELLHEISPKDSFTLKAFTDNIVLGWPVHNDAEAEFGTAFLSLAQFQFNMAIRGYFVRGAIAVAPAYVDEIVVFGDALSEAYEGECKLARDARIIFTESAVKAIKLHLSYYGSPSESPHSNFVLKDSDGQWFLNYLDNVFVGVDYGAEVHCKEFIQHKNQVEMNLAKYSSKPAIWSKYAWVAAYHNYFCDLHSTYFKDEHRIDVDLYRVQPSPLV